MIAALEKGKPRGLVVCAHNPHIRIPFFVEKEKRVAERVSGPVLERLIIGDGRPGDNINLLIASRSGAPMPDKEELELFARLESRNPGIIAGNITLADSPDAKTENEAKLTLYTRIPGHPLYLEKLETPSNPDSLTAIASMLGAVGLSVAQIRFEVSTGLALGNNVAEPGRLPDPYAQLTRLYQES